MGETGPIEIISAMAYIFGTLFFYLAARNSAPPIRYHFFMWILFCTIFFGEETSWLQHYLGFETPESIKAMNAQNEFNIHNLDFLHGRKIIRDGELVKMDWKHFLLSSQMLFQLGFGIYFFAIPVLRKISGINQVFKKFGFPQIEMSFIFPIVITLSTCLVFNLLNRGDHLSKGFWAETREMIFALGIFYFSLIAYFKSLKSHQ
jgi:hypothetical protein